MREMLAERGVKGFCTYKALNKPMPKVSQAEVETEERKQIKPKTNIATMAIAEINDYLKDPVLQKQLTPQLFHSNYELITDYLGQIIGVKLSELQIREKRCPKGLVAAQGVSPDRRLTTTGKALLCVPYFRSRAVIRRCP